MKHNTLLLQALLLSLLLFCGKTSLAQRFADCDSAYWVGTTYAIRFSGSDGIGANTTEAEDTPCFRNGTNYGQAEENCTWLRFDIDRPGTLQYIITPDNMTDDYDFVLYQLPADGNCKKKKIVRCMAAGTTAQDPQSPCLGVTGLRKKSRDERADAGCSDAGDDAWLAPAKVASGERYVLLVSNTTAAYQGFSILFKGDFTFKESQ